MAISAVSGVIIARLLGPSGFGVYSVVVVCVGLGATLVSFRLDVHLVSALRASAVDAPFVQDVVRASWLVAGLVVSLGVGVALAVRPAAWLVIILAAAEVVLSPLFLGRAVLQVQARQAALVASALAGRLLWLVLVGGIAAIGPASGLAAVLAARVTSLGAELALVWRLAHVSVVTTLAPRLLAPRRHIPTMRAAAPLLVAGLAGTIYNRADQLILAVVRGSRETGVYAAGVRIAELLGAVAPIVDNVTLPSLVELHRRNDESALRRAVHDATLLMTVPAGLFVALLLGQGTDLALLVLGDDYQGVGPIVGLLAVAEWVTLLGSVSSSTAVARGARGVLVRATLAGLGVNVLLNLALIPSFGAIAAAWAAIAGYGVASLYAYSVPALRGPLWASALVAIRVLLGILAAWGIGLTPLPLFVSLLAIGATYLVALRLLLPDDARRITRFACRAATRTRQ